MIRFEGLTGSTVCVCAPTRSSSEVSDLERRLGLAGASVLAPAPWGGQLSLYERAVLAVGIRWEIRDDIHEAFLTLGCALICWRRLKTSL